MNSQPDRPGSGDVVDPLRRSPGAAAVVFHLVGNPTLAPVWGKALLAASAVAVLARPRVAWLAALLAVAVLVNVWLEAPTLGNHWLLHGLVAVVVLGGVATGRADAGRAIARVGGPARLTLLAFYGFAAFAKLNTDFFDPAVSCAVFYLRESAGSLHLGSAVADLRRASSGRIAVAVAATELSIPVLLVVRRTRNWGVVVGLGFHFVLALDRSHQFFDFSSVLLALFLLFLDPATVAAWFDRMATVRAPARGALGVRAGDPRPARARPGRRGHRLGRRAAELGRGGAAP